MASKKPAPAKKRTNAKKRVGLTSAIGPKATTILVICVMAGGIALAARQREQAAAKAKTEAAETVIAADLSAAPSPAPKKTPTPKSSDVVEAAATTGSTARDAEPATPRADATITGCLERGNDNGFRLKDTAGENAPKARSWKSGFLKKGSASVSVIDPSRSLRLASHVGHRVTVSGTLANRELRAGTIHQVASSCKAD